MKHSFEMDQFLNSFRSLITEDIFEAFVLRRVQAEWTIIGCKWETVSIDPCLFTDSNQTSLKIYTLEERHAKEPLYVIINYHNQELDDERFPSNNFMNADMSDANLISFIESLRYENEDEVWQILRPIYRWIESAEFPETWYDYELNGDTSFEEEFVDRKCSKLRLFKESRMQLFTSCIDIFKAVLGDVNEEWVNHLFPTWIQEVCLTKQENKYHLYLDGAERVIEVWLNNNRRMTFFVDTKAVDENTIKEFSEKSNEFIKVVEKNQH